VQTIGTSSERRVGWTPQRSAALARLVPSSIAWEWSNHCSFFRSPATGGQGVEGAPAALAAIARQTIRLSPADDVQAFAMGTASAFDAVDDFRQRVLSNAALRARFGDAVGRSTVGERSPPPRSGPVLRDQPAAPCWYCSGALSIIGGHAGLKILSTIGDALAYGCVQIGAIKQAAMDG
jgi:hypothetical protein